MITAQTISILIDVLALVFILISFLIGLKRGLKSSINRFLLVLISAILAILLAKALSGTLMNINLPFLRSSSGQSTSINAFIADLLANYKLTDTITLGNFTLTIEAVVTLIKLLSNIFVFLALFEIFRFISWIFYMIFFRTKKSEIVAAKEAGAPINVHRWWGSLIGAFQGLFIFVFLFNPISGVSSVANSMIQTTSASNSNSGAGIIETYVPKQYQGYVKAYENSIFNKAFGWTKIDELIFDTLTTSKIDGMNVKFRDEAVNLNEIFKVLNKYEIIETFKNKNYKEKLNSLTDAQINEMVESVFEKTSNFSLAKCFLLDCSNILADKVGVEEKLSTSSIDWKKEGQIFASATTNIICSSRLIISSILESGSAGLTDEVLADETVDYARFGRGFDELANMQLLKNSYKKAVKNILDNQKIKDFGEKYGIDLSSIVLDNLNFEKTFNSVGGLLRTAVKIKNSATIENFATEDLADVLETIKDLDDEIKKDLNNVLVKTFEDQFEVDVPEDFNLFENEELLDSTIETISSLGKIEEDTAMTSESAGEVLDNIQTMLENENSQVILDVVAKSTGAEGTLPSVNEAKDAVTYLNEFISANDDDPELGTRALNLVNALNAQPNLITVLKFKGNTYELSTVKYSTLAGTAGVTENILSLFTERVG